MAKVNQYGMEVLNVDQRIDNNVYIEDISARLN